ncbi:Hint domain-containing protein [uncultured Sulfitobacter sp.]|uniref:Hint domain-containing protein n=1 Tax=uncultured Sulfitobacter sp. TaxID=191468 RepID=UPI00260CB936|nr:Hint domain-containing protein [uncultured Sulfitobacter sp.]
MPDQVIYGYSSNAFYMPTGNTVALDPDFDASADILRWDIDDADATLEGDTVNNEVGDDTTQYATKYDANGNYLNDGQIYAEMFYILDDGAGNTITLYAIEGSGGAVSGYWADDEIVPGVEYELATFGEVDSSNAPNYSDIHTPAFDPDDTNAIEGGAYNDTLDGGIRSDTIDGGAGDDSVFGDTGNDSLSGGQGDDTVSGGGGVDTVSGGSGSDLLDGGGGTSDRVVFDGAHSDYTFDILPTGQVVVTDTVNGGSDTIGGFEQIEFADGLWDLRIGSDGNDNIGDNGGLPDFVISGDGTDNAGMSGGDDIYVGGSGSDNLGGEGGNDTIYGGGGTDGIGGGDGDDLIDGGAGNDGIGGDAGNDTIYGGAGNDGIGGGAGNDLIDGGAGNDGIGGEAGNDTIFGGAGDDGMGGGDGDDEVYGGAGNDEISGDAGNDSVYGGTGDDSLSGGTGDDFIDGGEGSDTITLEDGFGNQTINGGSTGSDEDVIDLSDLSGPLTVVYSDTEDGTISDGNVTVSFSEIERIILTDQADSVDAFTTDGVTIDAGDGDDTVLGGNSNNTAADSIDGGAGNDSIEGFWGADTIIGGDGDDTIDGGDQGDIILGGAGNDLIFAGEEDGIGDDDSISGGDGNDTIISVETDDRSDDTISGDAGDDLIQTQGGDDSLSGGSGNDTIDGGTGDDEIDGGTGDDVLAGGADNDSLTGGAGDDSLSGGAGANTLTGGAGNDTFVAGEGTQTITDFNTGNTGTLDDGDSTNNDFVDLSGYYDHISELYKDQEDDGILNQSNTEDSRGNAVDYSDNDSFGANTMRFDGASADSSSFTQENTGVVCFTAGTAIRTPHGDVLIEEMRVGDMVCTLDNGPQPIRWIGQRHLGAGFLAARPALRPILIQRGILGAERDLLVSPQHGVLIGQHGSHLARARHLAENSAGIRTAHGKREITYIHILFDAHQIIFAENVPSESFFPGKMALKMIGHAQLKEVTDLFPELSPDATDQHHGFHSTARVFARKTGVQRLMRQSRVLQVGML